MIRTEQLETARPNEENDVEDSSEFRGMMRTQLMPRLSQQCQQQNRKCQTKGSKQLNYLPKSYDHLEKG